ncbi:MAG: baseplate J/gp47 family protein [Deltaproteobacteria bacterium]|nr:baseplate J/gp47 family protein [Deltaproteobacteria bacterium]
MPLLPVNIDYTDKDFDAIRSRLISLIQSVFPDWSDFSVASFGNVLMEMYAFVGDVVTFYLDNQARESRLITATQRKNVIALSRMLGYRLQGARSATAMIKIELARVPVADVVIPAGAIVRTKEVTEPVKFQLLTDVTIPANSDPPVASGIAEHSKKYTQLYDSRGLADLDIILDHTPFIDGSAVVSAANGIFEEQDSLLGSGPNDLHYTVLVDQNDRATVRFGNGTSGAPPTGTVRVAYKTGGGLSGNVDAQRLAVIEGAYADAHGNPVQISVMNPESASGGSDRQTMASAKLLVPESLRATTRTVAREDFEINARRVSGVARALMLTSNEDTGIEENSGILFIIPQGGGFPTPALKNQVLTMVTRTYPCTLTFQVLVQNPVYRTVDVEARIYIKQGYSPAGVRDSIKARLAEMFLISNPDGTPNPQVDFGFNIKASEGNPVGEVAWSDVFNIIRDTEGVRKIGDRHGDLKLSGLPADVKLGIREFPVLGTVSLINGDTGGFI